MTGLSELIIYFKKLYTKIFYINYNHMLQYFLL
jgi:hypothetical protein